MILLPSFLVCAEMLYCYIAVHYLLQEVFELSKPLFFLRGRCGSPLLKCRFCIFWVNLSGLPRNWQCKVSFKLERSHYVRERTVQVHYFGSSNKMKYTS